MLLTTTSYHQIMPSFLDFLFCFGAQHHAKDFFFTGFRHETRLFDAEKSVPIPDLGRSGRYLQLCYSLRSVEASPDQEKWPWSIRGTATHHAFDFETGRTSWLMVKGEGGASMKDRIIIETSSPRGKMFKRFDSRERAFSSALSTHLLLCNWSIENWRWYINYMEQEVQAITRKTLSVTVAQPPSEPTPKILYTRTVTGILVPPKKASTSKSTANIKHSTAPSTKVASPPPIQGPPGLPGPPPLLSTLVRPGNSSPSQASSEFSFEDLQRIEYIEEHANEALLVITLNSSVLSTLSQHYKSIMESAACPSDLKTQCVMDFVRFVDRISDILAELQTQKARVETLLRLLASRKALVSTCSVISRQVLIISQLYGILEYRNVEASRDLTQNAKISAYHVEYLTQQMKQEAVFMRIITLVTLFFLPGTFVSVSFPNQVDDSRKLTTVFRHLWALTSSNGRRRHQEV
jgi:Mg2+ and Co2+ transporter CorA